ncbi:hypothetical protein HMPREF3190_01682 [Umbribacter vaginalis]|nr:hypothetical protein HMPREF3190_01682 [Coriobacteriales bacterium DNF00809]
MYSVYTFKVMRISTQQLELRKLVQALNFFVGYWCFHLQLQVIYINSPEILTDK